MKSQTQRGLLFGFIGSIACCGLVGIYCLVIGTVGPFEAQVLGSTAVVGAASILSLACAVPWERRRWHPIGPVGMIAVTLAMILALIGIWTDFWHRAPWNDRFIKSMGIGSVVGLALPHVGLLSLARLRRDYGWVRRITIVFIVLLGGLLTYLIIVEPRGLEADLWGRLIGILAIAVVCGTIAVPILHRISAIRTREDVRTVELFLSMTCPRCGKSQKLPAGRSKCAACGLKFLIEIEEEHCPTCGYSLYRLESSVCPECGTPIAQQS